jgi:diaminopimelate epimerase
MHGIGNDYVYINCTGNTVIEEPSKLSKFVSDRHFGIGADGLILIHNSEIADFKMVMFNADGSNAEMCGNGIRCVGKFVYDKGLTNKEKITVETLAGIKTLDLKITDSKVQMVTVDMGEPIFEPSKIPVIIENNIGTNEFPKMKLKVLDKEFEFNFVSVGNPHAITVIEKIADFEIEKYGSILENDKHFPNRSNIEFIELVDKNTIKMRVWERGTGETLACGTGATASMIACSKNGLIERKAKVELLGGILEFDWNADNHVYMTGSATTVFEGELTLN